MAASSTSAGRTAGAGCGLLIVMLVYTAAGFGDVERVWAAAAVLAVGFVLGDGLGNLKSRIGVPGAVPAGILAVLVAMYLCVPETNQFVVAAFVPAAVFAAEVLRRRQIGVEWYALAAVSAGWAGMFGASGRQSALIGAVFAWWPLLLPMLVSRVIEGCSRFSLLASMMIGSVSAVVFARTGGISDAASSALVVVVLLAVGSAVGTWLVARRTTRGQASAPN